MQKSLKAKWFLAMLLGMGLFLGQGRLTARDKAPRDPGAKLLKMLQQSLARVEAADSYTVLFDKHESIRGRWQRPQTVLLKFKKPFKVYMHWETGFPGQELLYVQGENNNKLVGHSDGPLSWYVVNLDPTSGTAMNGNRYPVTSVGLANLIRLVQKNWLLAQQQGGGEISWSSEAGSAGMAQVASLRFKFKDAPGTDADACKVWFDPSGLLYRVDIERPENNLVGHYEYRNLNLKAGLTDEDFSRKNKSYHF